MINNIKSFKQAHSNEEGFTLIELMIVVVIIGILAAIAIPIFANQQRSAKDATLKQDIRTTNLALVSWLGKGQTIADAPFVDNTFKYIIQYNNGRTGSWPQAVSTTKRLFPGMTDFNISEGSRIAVKVTVPQIGYCIAGAIDGGNMDSTTNGNVSDTNKMLFYDSATGKITERSELSTDGACEYFTR